MRPIFALLPPLLLFFTFLADGGGGRADGFFSNSLSDLLSLSFSSSSFPSISST